MSTKFHAASLGKSAEMFGRVFLFVINTINLFIATTINHFFISTVTNVYINLYTDDFVIRYIRTDSKVAVSKVITYQKRL